MRIYLLILPLLLMGCMSSPNRNMFSDNLVGADLETARDSTQAIVLVEQQKTLGEAMVADLDGQGKIIVGTTENLDDASEVLSVYPKANAQVRPYLDNARRNLLMLEKANERLSKNSGTVVEKSEDLGELLNEINYRSQGKKYMSKLKLTIIWLAVGAVILLIFGIAVRTMPFFQPLHRLGSGMLNGVMDMTSGMWQARRSTQINHLNLSSTIDNNDLDPMIQAEIKKDQARALAAEARLLEQESRRR